MMETSPHERTVDAAQNGVRLDRFLADQPEVATRSTAKRLIADGGVEVAGRVAHKASMALAAGQIVRFASPQPALREDVASDLDSFDRLRVVFEDPYLLVIDKPAGLVAHRPEHARGPVVSVADLAERHCGRSLPTIAGEDRPGIVHRLDKDTSGLMVIAKTDESFHFIKAQFKARTTRKEYRAIAFGAARFDSDFIERRIGVHPSHGDRMAIVNDGGRDAVTYYEVVERLGEFTDFRCKPKTGRTHQIRVHMMSIGHSLVGDRVYRARNASQLALPAGAPDPGRQCLHAERLGLLHPLTHEPLSFEAPLPADMTALLQFLRARVTGSGG